MERQVRIPHSISHLNRLRINQGLISAKSNRVYSPLHNKIHAAVNHLYQNPHNSYQDSHLSPYFSRLQSLRYTNTTTSSYPQRQIYPTYTSPNTYFNQSLPSFNSNRLFAANPPLRYPQPLRSSFSPSVKTESATPLPEESQKDVEDYAEYLRSKLSSLNKDNTDLSAIYTNIGKHSLAIESENNEMKIVIAKMKERNSLSNSALPLSSIKNETRELNAMLLKEKDEQIRQLSEQIKKIEASNSHTQLAINKFEELMPQMNERMSQLPIDKETITKQIEEVHGQLRFLQEESNRKDKELAELLKRKQDNERANKVISDMQNDLSAYEGKIGELEHIIVTKDELIKELSKKTSKEGGSVQSIDYKVEYEQVSIKNEDMKKKCQELNGTIKELIGSREPMKQAYEQTIEKMKAVLEGSAQQFSEMNQIVADNDKLRQINEGLIKKIEALPEIEKTFKVLLEENQQLRNQLELEYKQAENDNDDQPEEGEEVDEQQDNNKKAT